MASPDHSQLGVPTADIVEWTRAFVRHPSPQTEAFEQEPQVQSFIGEQVVPLLQKLGLPWRRDKMGNLLVELGPEHSDRSLMLMAYAMTHPANRMPNPFAGELIEDPSGSLRARPRRLRAEGLARGRAGGGEDRRRPAVVARAAGVYREHRRRDRPA